MHPIKLVIQSQPFIKGGGGDGEGGGGDGDVDSEVVTGMIDRISSASGPSHWNVILCGFFCLTLIESRVSTTKSLGAPRLVCVSSMECNRNPIAAESRQRFGTDIKCMQRINVVFRVQCIASGETKSPK